MKNKFLKGAHLSERKFKEILKLFSEDLTATQIANISGVSRVTINSYLKKIRLQIVKYCESLQPETASGAASWQHRANSHHQGHDTAVAVKTDVERIIKPVIFGIFKQDNKVFTEILPDVSRSMIQAIARGRSVLETVGSAERIRRFSGVVDLGQYRLYHLGNHHHEVEAGKTTLDDVDGFWGLTKHRLAKFKGLNRNTAYLHLKECEFRYNYRHEELYAVLLNLLKTFPLNLS
ncbi:IS1595 family transposase [Chitinophaga sp. GCM10012297]|uniref:IS1595 family transposase n=1 Tax=Chitinophaga chungangae TaxID=2821488 RepID=A0ABS3YD84_9BACT|nr:IS1595 family transposase [Chitinophaga chungangae]MBO9152647.1 IS1595 family transposase [Chitinophaga chungangae]